MQEQDIGGFQFVSAKAEITITWLDEQISDIVKQREGAAHQISQCLGEEKALKRVREHVIEQARLAAEEPARSA